MAFESKKTIILYQITQLSEQKYRLAIPFAENNFGPFEHIVFAIVLFESPSKTLLRVLFASLYLQICIFYQYIHFLVRLWARSELIPTGNTNETVKTMRRMYRMTLEGPEMDSQGQIAPTRVSLTSSRLQELLIGQLLRNVRKCE
jgi:hypothetical protein